MDYSTIGTPMGNSGKCRLGKTKWRNMSHMLKDYYKAIEALRVAREWMGCSQAMDHIGVTEGRMKLDRAQTMVDKAIANFEDME